MSELGKRSKHAGRLAEHLVPLVAALKADPEKQSYYLALLKPLEEYDLDHHGDLVQTLSAYLRHGSNSTQAAEALFMHRNSLRYRLARIRALTGLDLDNADDRLALQVALVLLREL